MGSMRYVCGAVLAVCVVLTQIGVVRAQPAIDPVAAFEALIQRASAATPGSWVYFAQGAKKWARGYARLDDVKYDVKKTDSLVAPLAAVVTFKLTTSISPRFDSQSEAEATRAIDASLPDRLEVVALNYAWRDNRWVLTSGEREVGFARPGMPRDRLKVTPEGLAADKASRLRFWLPDGAPTTQPTPGPDRASLHFKSSGRSAAPVAFQVSGVARRNPVSRPI